MILNHASMEPSPTWIPKDEKSQGRSACKQVTNLSLHGTIQVHAKNIHRYCKIMCQKKPEDVTKDSTGEKTEK